MNLLTRMFLNKIGSVLEDKQSGKNGVKLSEYMLNATIIHMLLLQVNIQLNTDIFYLYFICIY